MLIQAERRQKGQDRWKCFLRPSTAVTHTHTHTRTHAPASADAGRADNFPQSLPVSPQRKHRIVFDPNMLILGAQKASFPADPQARLELGHHPMRQRSGRLRGSHPAAARVPLPAKVWRLLRVSVTYWAASKCGSAPPGPVASRRSDSGVPKFGAGLCSHPAVSCFLCDPQARLLCAHAARARGWREGGGMRTS